MREPEEYKKWHIIDAISFHHILLNQDKIIPELFRVVSLNLNCFENLIVREMIRIK
jgi:rhodanese-related sulfurtransferase